MEIRGLNKLTLIDYPGQIACTIFTGGCNYRCPFCHNGNLVMHPEALPAVSMEELFSFLDKRQTKLDAVVISGGEPTLHEDLFDFIKEIKAYNLLVKLDTNGSNPASLIKLIENNLVDYVAMDIKTQKEQYHTACGVAAIDITPVNESVNYLLSGHTNYEFRTTVCKELHNEESFRNIASWIKGCSSYYLQSYEESSNILACLSDSSKSFSSYTNKEMFEFAELLKGLGINCMLRG